MPSVLDRSALEQSPLADLHLLANELGVDGFRRLRKGDLVDAILTRQSGEAVVAPDPEFVAEVAEVAEVEAPVEAVAERPAPADDDEGPKRSRRGRRGGRGRRREEEEGGDSPLVDRDEPAAAAPVPVSRGGGDDERTVEGSVELLANGSGFLRLTADPTDDDVYISAAQVKRCELVSGDRVAGPMRPARRSERYASLIRVETINGRPAEEVAEGTRFEDLPVAWPSERIQLGSDDPTVTAIEWLTPFGKGSRVVIAGPSRSGKSEALKRLAAALAARSELEVSAVLIGVRPEEIADFPVTPGSALSFSASVEAQAQAVEQAVEVGRRVAARGGDAVVLIDSLEYLAGAAARRALSAGRNLAGGGSLTVIATSPLPVGGETTVVTLDRAAVAAGNFPALALGESGTLRPELLVGEAGTDAIRAAGAGTAPAPVVVPEAPVAEAPVAAPSDAASSDADAPAAARPSRRRSRAAKAAPEPVAAESAPVAEAPAAEPAAAPSSRRRSRAAKPAAEPVVEAAPEPAAAEPEPAAKPAPKPGRSRSRAAKPKAEAKKPAAKPAAKRSAKAAAKPAAAKPAAAKPAAAKRKPGARKRAPKRAAE
jgi:transcription termination factor Rho